jgi:hypothetical protein
MQGYDEHYYDIVNFHREQISGLHARLDSFKLEYLLKLYRQHVDTGVSPEALVQEWLLSVWGLCHYGGKGYLFSVISIDEGQLKPSCVKEAISRIHHIGCSCHTWPCHWNVKSENYTRFKETITPEITKAFQALGLKIFLSSSDTFHVWND